MPQQVIEVHPSLTVLVKSTVEGSFDVFEADFDTGEVTSTILPARTCEILTQRLQTVIAAVPNVAELELGFAGLVRSILTAIMFEDGDFEVLVNYVAPTATYTVSGLVDPAHVCFSLPFSTSSPVIGEP